MKIKKWIGLLGLILLASAACAEEAAPTPTTTIPATIAATSAPVTPTAEPSPSNTPLPTPEPTPVQPLIDVSDQSLFDDGTVMIARVVTPGAGWLVLYNQKQGEPGDIVGHTAVAPGVNNDLTLIIDPQQATTTMIAMLHEDEGEPDSFEFPDGPDGPLTRDEARIAAPFSLDFQFSQPVVDISPQLISPEGTFTVDAVVAPQKGWLAFHADAGGEVGDFLGAVPIPEGRSENLAVTIPWREATPTMYALVLTDDGRVDRLDYPGADEPYVLNGELLIAPFTLQFPPDIYVLDQPVIDNEIVVERIISNGPGWLVVYGDNDGTPGFIIGSAPLEDGLNEQIVVDLSPSGITNPLHLRIHEDTEPGDEFDFPRVDPPVLYEERLPEPFTIIITPGNYLVVRDQPLDPEADNLELVIPLIVVESPSWVVIHANNGGTRGEIIDQLPASPGINRDLTFSLDTAGLTDTLFVVLYLDDGEIGEFEFPDGPDVPLQRNRAVIEVPIYLQSEETAADEVEE